MAGYKLSMAMLLLLSGMVMMGEVQRCEGGRVCPQYCIDVDYMTCDSSGLQRMPPRCGCCSAPKNCTLHYSDGREVFCS